MKKKILALALVMVLSLGVWPGVALAGSLACTFTGGKDSGTDVDGNGLGWSAVVTGATNSAGEYEESEVMTVTVTYSSTATYPGTYTIGVTGTGVEATLSSGSASFHLNAGGSQSTPTEFTFPMTAIAITDLAVTVDFVEDTNYDVSFKADPDGSTATENGIKVNGTVVGGKAAADKHYIGDDVIITLSFTEDDAAAIKAGTLRVWVTSEKTELGTVHEAVVPVTAGVVPDNDTYAVVFVLPEVAAGIDDLVLNVEYIAPSSSGSYGSNAAANTPRLSPSGNVYSGIGDFIIKSSGFFNLFDPNRSFYANGVKLEAGVDYDYINEGGFITFTVFESTMRQLSGVVTFRATFKNDTAGSTKVTVNNAYIPSEIGVNAPKTGSGYSMLGFVLLSIAGLAAVAVRKARAL